MKERKERQKQALAYFVFRWLYGPAERLVYVERWLCIQLRPAGWELLPRAGLKPHVGLEGHGSCLDFAALLTSLPLRLWTGHSLFVSLSFLINKVTGLGRMIFNMPKNGT